MKQMIRKAICMAAVLAAPWPARANFVTEPTFDEKMMGSTLVVIGTVTAVELGSTATLAVQQRLKGESSDTIVVQTRSRIAELNPRCCERDATYLMFLVPSRLDGSLHSYRGIYGMIRIGGPRGRETIVCPTEDVRSCPRRSGDARATPYD